MANEEEQDFSDASGDLSAENNARQINMRNIVARKSEMARMKSLATDGGEEMSGVDDGIPDDDPSGGMTDAYPYQVSDETLKASLAKLPKAEAIPAKHKIKVNGQEQELTYEELVARAQKVEAADQYLAEAKRAAEAAKAAPVHQPVASAQEEQAQPDTLTDEDLALARALQVGSEEDAARAIRAIRQRAAPPSAINLDEVAAKTKDQIEFQQDVDWFQKEYKDIFSDENLKTLAIQMDDAKRREDLAAGRVRRYRDRYVEIGEELRKWIGTNPAFEAKAKAKKETLTNIPQASVKARLPVEEEDGEESPSSVIAQMAAKRGQIRM
jgi:hypothetical protein